MSTSSIHTRTSSGRIIKNSFTEINQELESIGISFQNLSFAVPGGFGKDRKEILHKINGKFYPGQLIAIIGPSGAGKTSLLELLCGQKVKNTRGQIFINETHQDIRKMKKHFCYIPDKNHLQPLLTVWENMKFAADLHLLGLISYEKKEIIIRDILISLLLEDQAQIKVEFLSGGQQKRLSIALQLIKNPMAMFLDEPTTGLDSYSCFQSVRLLKKLTRQGKTIICSIHQPPTSLFQLFDHVYVVASGKCVYQGAPNNLVKYLECANFQCPKYYNPVDYIVELVSAEYENINIETLVELSGNGRNHEWLENSIPTKVIHDVPNYHNNNTISAYSQFLILVRRSFLTAKRDKALTYIRLAVNLFIGVLCGCLYWQKGIDGNSVSRNTSFIYSVIIHNMMSSMMLTLISVSKNIPIITNEYFNGWYSLRAYFAASTLCDIPISVFCCLVFTFIVYPMTGQPMEFIRLFVFTIISIMVTLVSQGLGMLIGSGFNIVNGTFVSFSLAVPTIVLGNFAGLNKLPINLDWMGYMSYIKYAFEGIFISIYGFNREPLYCPEDRYCHYKYPKKILKDYSLDPDRAWFDFLVLSIFFILIKFITYKMYKFNLNRC